MNNKYVTITIEGRRPGLLMNRFHEGVIADLGKSDHPDNSAKLKGQPPRVQAYPKAYMYDNEELFLPAENLYSAIISAGTFFKRGRAKLTNAKSSIIPGGIAMITQDCPLVYPVDGSPIKFNEVEISEKRVVNPNNGIPAICYRPWVDEWQTSFELEVDVDEFQLDLVRDLIDKAGKSIGVCDFRPQRKGPYGTFVVTSWQEGAAN